MKTAVTHSLLLGFTMLSLACTQASPEGSFEATDQPDDAELVFSSLDIDQTNRGTIKINGYERHFSVTFPISYDKVAAYPVVLFFHGCICRPEATDETVLRYLDWSQRLEPYREDFIFVKMSAYSEKKPGIPQDVEDGGARGMWFWHEGFESERDDFVFVHTLIGALRSSPEINIDPENIFGVGHSSGAIFLISFVLGGAKRSNRSQPE
jgi:poly(3-hydroxybutyrate) depolymerase